MPTKANALGRVLRYFGDAFAYAKPVQHSKLSLALLEGMAASPWYLTGGQGDEDEYELATSSYAAYSAIKLVASRATTKDATFQAQREDADGELEEEKAHPFTKLLKRPNTLMSGSFLMRYTVWWFLLRGNAYIFIATPAPGSGEPVELLPLAADMMQPMPETMRQGKGVYAGQQVIDFEYSTGTYKQQLPGENVIHFRTPNPHDYWVGLSPLAPALLPLRSDEAQGQWVSDFFGKKNAIPSAIMSVPAETSEQDFGVIREMLREQFEAGQRTLITRAGDLSVEVIQQTLEQMQVLGSREFNAKAIDRIYGIPEGLITGGLSGDSRLAAEIALARNTVQPLLDYFAEELTGSLAIYYGEDIVITAPNVVPQDRALDLQEYNAYGQDRTINENRQELGLEPLKNDVADQVPVRLLQWVAPNYATLDGSEPEPEPMPAALEPFAQPGQTSTNGNGSEPGLPAMEGTATPEQVVEQLAGKAHTNGHDPVATLALRTELQRWRKVAMREAKAGRNPAEREFESAVVPAELAAELRTVLDGADEARVLTAFEEVVKGGPGSGNFGHEGRPGERGGSAGGGGTESSDEVTSVETKVISAEGLLPAKAPRYHAGSMQDTYTAAIRMSAYHEKPAWLWGQHSGLRISMDRPSLPQGQSYTSLDAKYDKGKNQYTITRTQYRVSESKSLAFEDVTHGETQGQAERVQEVTPDVDRLIDALRGATTALLSNGNGHGNPGRTD